MDNRSWIVDANYYNCPFSRTTQADDKYSSRRSNGTIGQHCSHVLAVAPTFEFQTMDESYLRGYSHTVRGAVVLEETAVAPGVAAADAPEVGAGVPAVGVGVGLGSVNAGPGVSKAAEGTVVVPEVGAKVARKMRAAGSAVAVGVGAAVPPEIACVSRQYVWTQSVGVVGIGNKWIDLRTTPIA